MAGDVLPAASGTTRLCADGEALPVGLAVALGLTVAEPVPEALAVAVGEAVADPLAVGDGAVTGTASVSSGRNCSSAVPPTSLMSLALAPGTDTTIRSLPWVTTSAEDTPRPSTRLVMIWRAWSMLDFDGALPLRVCAFRITWAPPCRSRPSLGVRGWCGQNTMPYSTTNRPSSTAK